MIKRYWSTLVFYNRLLKLKSLEAKNTKLTGKRVAIRNKQKETMARYEALNEKIKLNHGKFKINPDELVR